MNEFGKPEQTAEQLGVRPQEMGDREAKEKEAEQKFRSALLDLVKEQSLDYPELTDKDKSTIASANDTKPYLWRGKDGKFGIGSVELIRRLKPGEEVRSGGWREDSKGSYVNSGPSRGMAHGGIEQITEAEKRSGSREGSDIYLKNYLTECVSWRSEMVRDLQEMLERDRDDFALRGFKPEDIEQRIKEIDAIEELRREMFPGV